MYYFPFLTIYYQTLILESYSMILFLINKLLLRDLHSKFLSSQ